MELSIDPVQKSLLRIFCQSIDSAIGYKSIEYSNKTTAEEVIHKLTELLFLTDEIKDLILCETIGRCMALNSDGTIMKKLAKSGQASIFIEQHRRVLLGSELIATSLNYWRPNKGFTRRIELCNIHRTNQISDTEIMCNSLNDANKLSFPITLSNDGSFSTSSGGNVSELENKYTQTDVVGAQSSCHVSKYPCLLTLKGDGNSTLLISLSDYTEFGTPGSGAKICLRKLSKYEKQILCTFSKIKMSKQSGYNIVFENFIKTPNLCITINGLQTTSKVVLFPGDIINIGEFYSFFFKDDEATYNDTKDITLRNRANESCSNKLSNNKYSDLSDQSDQISSMSDINSCGNKIMSTETLRSPNEIPSDLNSMTLDSFDKALNQVILSYVNNRIKLRFAVGLTSQLIRFCRESTIGIFNVADMHDRMMRRFCVTIEESYRNDSYLLCNLKLSALGFQTWMVYYNDNCLKATEENRQWLKYLEDFTVETFSHLSNYICETANNMSLCFFDENPLSKVDHSDKETENTDMHTMEKLLDFLNEVYLKIDMIDCSKTIDIFKRVLTSRMVMYLTESTVTVLLSGMKEFTWNKGVQISTQLDKFEKWLKKEEQLDIYEADGFLRDFSKLVSTRLIVLKKMDWVVLRHNYKGVHPSVLRQFLSSLVADEGYAPSHWKPPQKEIYESNLDVGVVLSEYLRSGDPCALFQPGIILQNDCIAVDQLIRSPEFISICTDLDVDLVGVGTNFQWKTLTNLYKTDRLVSHHTSFNKRRSETINASSQLRKKIPSVEKKILTNKMQANIDIHPSSHDGETIASSAKRMVNYLNKSNLKAHSKSLMSLNVQHGRDRYYHPQTNGTKSIGTANGINNKRCPSFNSDIDIISTSNNTVDYSIRAPIETKMINRSYGNLNNISERRSSVLRSSKKTTSDYDGDNSLPTNIMTRSSAGQGKINLKESTNNDKAKRIEVILTKSTEESYGITIADGMLTKLKKEGIFIYEITKDSPAYKYGKLMPGDEILKINNYIVQQLNFPECLMMMKKSLTVLNLLIERSDFQEAL